MCSLLRRIAELQDAPYPIAGWGSALKPRYNRLDFWGETDLWIHWAQRSSLLEGALD